MKVELVRWHHSVGESNYHVILIPKLEQFGAKLVAIEFGPDHVHMFWACVKKAALEKIIGQVKGYSRYMKAILNT